MSGWTLLIVALMCVAAGFCWGASWMAFKAARSFEELRRDLVRWRLIDR